MKRLAVAAAAVADLRDIARYSERTWGIAQARRYLDGIRARFARLRERPQLGSRREELGPGLRSVMSGRHIIFYMDAADRIEIVRVLHASMDVRRHLAEMPRSGSASSSAERRSRGKRRQRSFSCAVSRNPRITAVVTTAAAITYQVGESGEPVVAISQVAMNGANPPKIATAVPLAIER